MYKKNWLKSHGTRFTEHLNKFIKCNGKEFFDLSRQDLIDITGVVGDGIALFNAREKFFQSLSSFLSGKTQGGAYIEPENQGEGIYLNDPFITWRKETIAAIDSLLQQFPITLIKSPPFSIIFHF